MHRIELQQVSGGDRIPGRVVDVHQLNARAAPQGAEHKPTDATEAVAANPHASPFNQSNYVDPNRARGTALVIQNTLSTDQSRQLLKALAQEAGWGHLSRLAGLSAVSSVLDIAGLGLAITLLLGNSNSSLLSADCNVSAHIGVVSALIAEAACNRRSEQQVITFLLNTDSDLRGLAAIGVDSKWVPRQ